MLPLPSAMPANTNRSNPVNTSFGGITEILLPSQRNAALFMPSLAFLSREGNDRWLTWLMPNRVTKSLLQHYGFDFGKTRCVYPKNDEHCLALMWQALAEGNSHTVVASPGRLTEYQLARLEQASEIGRCNGLLLRGRG